MNCEEFSWFERFQGFLIMVTWSTSPTFELRCSSCPKYSPSDMDICVFQPRNPMANGKRWAPTSYTWSYNPYKWPYTWVTGCHNPYKWSWTPTYNWSWAPNRIGSTCSPLDCDFHDLKPSHGRKTGSTTQQSSPCTKQKSKSVIGRPVGVFTPSICKKKSAQIGNLNLIFVWKTFKKNIFENLGFT